MRCGGASTPRRLYADQRFPVSRSLHILILLIALLTSPSHLLADQALPDSSNAIALDLPAQCQSGETCWAVNYVDVDSSVAAKDFQCHERTYNGHDGIDLAIPDRGVMERGVSVIAAAPGTIRQVRDGAADVGLSKANSREAIAGRECGIGVVIDHGHGWETQYCHLKQHSMRITIGERVEQGSELGLIGLSGKTEFSHVHLTVRLDGQIIDPFTGRPREAGCGAPNHSLWRDPRITYEDVVLYHAGFASEEPQIDAIRGGHAVADALSADAATLVLWVDIFGVQANDRLRVQITTPDGCVILDRELRIDRTQARRFMFAGLRRQSPHWPSGTYHGAIRLQRGPELNALIKTRAVNVQIP